MVRPDGLMANFPFSYADRAADDDGWEMYSDIGNTLFSFLVDEEAEAHGAEELDIESRLKVVANINDLCESIDDVPGGAKSFSFVKELDAYVYMEFIPEGATLLAVAMNKDNEETFLGVHIREQLEHTTPTMLGFRIVDRLEKGMGKSNKKITSEMKETDDIDLSQWPCDDIDSYVNPNSKDIERLSLSDSEGNDDVEYAMAEITGIIQEVTDKLYDLKEFLDTDDYVVNHKNKYQQIIHNVGYLIDRIDSIWTEEL